MSSFSLSVARLSIGLVSVTLCLLIGADWLFGMLRDDVDIAQRTRKAITENLAVQLVVLIEKDDRGAVQRTLDAVAAHGGDILSVAIRRGSGSVYVQTAEHGRQWVPLKDERSTITHVSVPLYNGADVWGKIEVSYRPVFPATILGFLDSSLVRVVLLMVLGGFPAYSLYLRRVLANMRPRKPRVERVGRPRGEEA
jgi:hypothetical protein